jgi:hypothetical protein
LNLHSEFHAKCGSLPINLSIIFPACTIDGVGRRQLHSHFQTRRDLSGYTIRKSEGSRTPDGSIGVAYQVPYKNLNEKLLHLSHLLGIGSPRDMHMQGVLQEEDLTQFNCAQSQARQDMDTLNNHDYKLDFVSCSSCRAALACDAIATEEKSAESGGGQEAVLRVFRVCGLTNDQDRASLNTVGEFIYSFFCHFPGGSQHLEEACIRVVLRGSNCCALTATPRANSGPSRDMLKSEGASRRRMRSVANTSEIHRFVGRQPARGITDPLRFVVAF